MAAASGWDGDRLLAGTAATMDSTTASLDSVRATLTRELLQLLGLAGI